MGHTVAHSRYLENWLKDSHGSRSGSSHLIQLLFCSLQTTGDIKPNFKKLYTKDLLLECFQVASATDLTFKMFWKEHHTTLFCVGFTEKSWANVCLSNDTENCLKESVA